MKLVKTNRKNCLTDDALTDLIRINLHCADIKEFEVVDQIMQCGRKKKRAAAAKSDESSVRFRRC